MMGFKREFAYPSQRKRLERDRGMGEGSSCKNGRTRASTKKGNQQTVKALIIIPRVVEALRSLARANLSFLWWASGMPPPELLQGADELL